MIHDAACWTVVQPVTGTLTVETIAQRLGGQPGGLEYEPDDGIDECDYEAAFWIGRSGSSFVVFEDNGYQGVRPEVLRTLSAGARTVSLFWNVNAHARLVYAAYGTVITELDPLFPETRWGKAPHALDAELALLEQDEYGWRSAAMEVVRAITGVELGGPEPGSARLLLEESIPGDPVPPSPLGDVDPDLDVRLRLAPEPVRLAVLHRAMTACMNATGLIGKPVVQEALASLAGSRTGPELSALSRRLLEEWHAIEEDDRTTGHALRALEVAVTGRRNAYPFRERLDALVMGPGALGDAWPPLRAEFVRMIGASIG